MSHDAEKESKARLRSSQEEANGRILRALSDVQRDNAETTTNLVFSSGMIAASSAGARDTQSEHSAVPFGMPSQRRRVGTR